MQRGGWRTLLASVFLVVLILGLWGYLGNLLALHGGGTLSPRSADIFGRVFVAFALVLVTGVLGTIGGVMQLRSGRRNRALTFAAVLTFVAAIGTVVLSAS